MLAFVLNNQQVTHVCDLHWDHFVCHNNHLKVPTNQARLDLSQQLWGTSALIANRKNSEETFHKCYIFLLQHLTLLVNRVPLGHVMHHALPLPHFLCTQLANRSQDNKGVAGSLLLAGKEGGNSSTSLCLSSLHSPGPGGTGACLHIIYSHIWHYCGGLKPFLHILHKSRTR